MHSTTEWWMLFHSRTLFGLLVVHFCAYVDSFCSMPYKETGSLRKIHCCTKRTSRKSTFRFEPCFGLQSQASRWNPSAMVQTNLPRSGTRRNGPYHTRLFLRFPVRCKLRFDMMRKTRFRTWRQNVQRLFQMCDDVRTKEAGMRSANFRWSNRPPSWISVHSYRQKHNHARILRCTTCLVVHSLPTKSIQNCQFRRPI